MSTKRVFFALWPTASVAAAIAARASALAIDGRRVARDRLHLTLAFHGRCDDAAIRACKRKADAVVIPAFDLVLDRMGHFRRPGITWFGPAVTPTPLAALARALAPCSHDVPGGYRFTAHVSVARKSAPVAPLPIASIIWPVRAFTLIASGRDGAPGIYRQLAQWPLKDTSVSSASV